MKTLITVLVIVSLLPAIAVATDYYVDANKGSNVTGDGTQAKPWKTISFALARISGTGHTIHVAAGTYDTVMDGTWYEIFPLLMKNGVSLVGAGADSTILDADSTAGVIQCVGITDTTTRIEGFTLQRGATTNGGGIYCSSSSLVIANNVIRKNRAVDSGGGIYWSGGSKARIWSNQILDNNAGQFGSSGGGAGVYISLSGTGTSVQIVDNVIRNNQLAGSFGDGGGLYIISATSVLISNNEISDNRSNSSFEDGGGIYLSSYSATSVITDNQISNNTASDNGGGLYWKYSNGEINRNQFRGNVSDDNGAGVYFSSSSSVEFKRNLVYDNRASKAGGGIYCDSSSPKIFNNTIDGNRTGSGGGGIYLNSSSPEIVNNILSNNERYAIHEADANSDPPLRYNDFWGNVTGLYFDEGARGFTSLAMLEALVPEAHHNLAADPLYVDRTNKDYHLQSGSPCIDAGDPSSPLDPDGTWADIGALYYDQSGGDTTPPPAPQNLTANGSNPSPWKNTPGFTISWTNPSDPSGIARAYYKLGTAPTSNADTTGSAPGTPPFNLNATQQGGQLLYVWLKDGAHNTNYQNNASVNLRYDGTAPSVPTLLSPSNNSSTNNPKPSFDWSDATDTGGSGLSSYEIQVDNNADFSSPEFSATPTTSTATPTSNLAHGTYSWRVRAKDGATNLSNWSTVWTFQIDTQAPASVANLNVSSTTSSSVTLTWTAPGDDGNTGTATTYDVRYSTSPMDASNWDSATQATDEPTPQVAGSAETFMVSNLSSNTTYYFAIKGADEAGNWSELSNVASGTTTPSAGRHFIFKPNTGDSYSIVVDTATIDGILLQSGDEIGVFTPARLCVGASVWDGTIPLPLTAWADDSQTPERDGYIVGEQMFFRIWDASASAEYPASPMYSVGNGTFGDGAYARISRLEGVSTTRFRISGRVDYYQAAKAVTGVQIALSGAASGTDTTGSDGSYSFQDIPAGNIALTPSKGADLSRRAVNNSDALLILKKTAFLVTFTPDQLIAGDVTGDNQVTNSDAQAVLRYTAFFGTYIHNTGQWAFQPPQISLNLTQDAIDQNFKGYLLGDVNGDWSSSSSAKTIASSDWSNLSFVLGEVTAEANGEVKVPIFVEMSGPAIESLNFAFEYDVHELEYRCLVLTSMTEGWIEADNAETEPGKIFVAMVGLKGIEHSGEVARLIFVPKAHSPSGHQSTPVLFRDAKANEVQVTELRGSLVRLTSVPTSFELTQNYPNPFNPETTIHYTLPEAPSGTLYQVSLRIYNLAGQEVRTLVDEEQGPGRYGVRWDGRNGLGNPLPSGVYLYHIRAGNFSQNRKAVLIK